MLPTKERILFESGLPQDGDIPSSGPLSKPYQFSKNLTRINVYYKTDHICPVVVYPYQAVDFWYHISEYASGRITPANELIKDIILHTPRPKFVEQYVTEFLRDLGEGGMQFKLYFSTL